MKRRIEYLLKHSTFVQKAYKLLMGSFFRFVGLFCKIDNNLVLFSSFSGKRFDDSPKAIFEELKRREEGSSLRMVWAFNDPERFKNAGLETVKMDSMKYFLTALKAKYWITNVNIERGLKFKKPETIYLNTWHGTPIKTIGNAVSGRTDYDFSYVNIITSDGEYFKQRMVEDFNAKPEAVLLCGRPCDDDLFSRNTHEDQLMIRERLGIPKSKRVILYAPTWRDSSNEGVSFSFAPPIDIAKWKTRLGSDTVLLFRAHSIMSEVLGLEFDDVIRDCSNYPNLNDLILASDLLISDYSGMFFDYAITSRPMLCFCYDYEEYASARGMYFDIRNHLSSFCTEDELLDYLTRIDYEGESEKTKAFLNTFAGFGGNGTKSCVDKLLSLRNKQ